jgi:hypothetical protein
MPKYEKKYLPLRVNLFMRGFFFGLTDFNLMELALCDDEKKK